MFINGLLKELAYKGPKHLAVGSRPLIWDSFGTWLRGAVTPADEGNHRTWVPWRDNCDSLWIAVESICIPAMLYQLSCLPVNSPKFGSEVLNLRHLLDTLQLFWLVWSVWRKVGGFPETWKSCVEDWRSWVWRECFRLVLLLTLELREAESNTDNSQYVLYMIF